MKSIRTIVGALAGGSALALGAAAFAQDAKKPEQPEAQARDHQHRHGAMRGMEQRGDGCHGQAQSHGRDGHGRS
jgi:hypothetical protein